MSPSRRKRIFYMPADHIIEYHDKVIKKHGGRGGLYPDSGGRVESVLHTVQYYSGLRYRSLVGKAAYLMYLLIKGHSFPDGNKRTGILSGMVFLHLNGFDLEANETELEEFACWLADSSPSEKDQVITKMMNWLRPRIIKTKNT